MGVFSSIMQKIFHHPAAAASRPQAAAPQAPAGAPAAVAPAQAASSPQPQGQPQQAQSQPDAMSPVDVEAVLSEMAQDKGGGGNWRSSIVDLLKVLDLDSSLQARKALADELDVHVAADGSAEENIALHHAVMAKLAENGGMVPDSLRH